MNDKKYNRIKVVLAELQRNSEDTRQQHLNVVPMLANTLGEIDTNSAMPGKLISKN